MLVGQELKPNLNQTAGGPSLPEDNPRAGAALPLRRPDIDILALVIRSTTDKQATISAYQHGIRGLFIVLSGTVYGSDGEVCTMRNATTSAGITKRLLGEFFQVPLSFGIQINERRSKMSSRHHVGDAAESVDSKTSRELKQHCQFSLRVEALSAGCENSSHAQAVDLAHERRADGALGENFYRSGGRNSGVAASCTPMAFVAGRTALDHDRSRFLCVQQNIPRILACPSVFDRICTEFDNVRAGLPRPNRGLGSSILVCIYANIYITDRRRRYP
jgi:hypothetical protein